ncbi:MAG: helix-turn-helix domain-containing protein [Pirellula sp.]
MPTKIGRAMPKRSRVAPEREDRVFKALANRDRRAILDFVSEQPRSTGTVCELLPELDRCTVMLHLKILVQAELLIAKKVGRSKLHYFNAVPIQRVYERWIKRIAQPAAKLLTAIATDLKR